MRARLAAAVLAIIAVTSPGQSTAGANRQWQSGTWTNIDISRQLLDFGPGASAFGGPTGNAPRAAMRAMADVRVYTIETDERHIEFKDVVAVGKRSVEAVVGAPVTFALEKKTIYVRDADGIEHKFSVTKSTIKPKRTI